MQIQMNFACANFVNHMYWPTPNVHGLIYYEYDKFNIMTLEFIWNA